MLAKHLRGSRLPLNFVLRGFTLRGPANCFVTQRDASYFTRLATETNYSCITPHTGIALSHIHNRGLATIQHAHSTISRRHRSRGKQRNGGGRARLPDMREFKSVAEVLRACEPLIKDLNPTPISICWSCIAKLVTQNKGERRNLGRGEKEFQNLLGQTIRSTQRFGPVPLATTASSLAKISIATGWNAGPSVWDGLQERAQDVIGEFEPRELSNIIWAFAKVGYNTPVLFDMAAEAAVPQLSKFNAHSISNMTWAYAKAGHAEPALFDAIAEASILKLETFKPQDLSNMAWAYATAGHAAPALFEAIAEASVSTLEKFKPQALSNTVWAYATAGHAAPALFDAIAEASVSTLEKFKPQALSNMAWAYATVGHAAPALFEAIAEASILKLEKFKPQALSNTVWAYATSGHTVPALFEAIAEASVSTLEKFKPQELSNTVWAYGTAGHAAPALFEAIAKTSVSTLEKFKPQALSNTVWAYATAGHTAPALFDEIAKISVPKLSKFVPQALSNMVWAYATVGHAAPTLFEGIANMSVPELSKFTPQELSNMALAYATLSHAAPSLFDGIAKAAVPHLNQFNPQNLANLAWAFAVQDLPCEDLFGPRSQFIDACISNADLFSRQGLFQLHQCQLWCEEHKRASQLPLDLRKRCREAFIMEEGNPSKLQIEVTASLKELGLDPQEEMRTGIGYSIDAVVMYEGHKVGVEVDGPSHFINRSPTGATILKCRQLRRLEGWCLVWVPYWEWDASASKDRTAEFKRELRKKYLLKKLEQAVKGHGKVK